jgi:3-methylfumaryl-CoA hydratase
MAEPVFTAEPTAHDICALPLVRRIAAMLDQDADRWREGMPLPRGWEFVLFAPVVRQSDLRADGHHLSEPDLGTGAPLKVMLGGRRFRFGEPLPIGAHLTRTSEIVSVDRKEGRAGTLTIVTRRHRILLDASGAMTMEEEEDMVYRAVEAGVARKTESAPPPATPADAERPYCPDEPLLFRYSALGNNAHRIHYDQPFATQQEGYPALVVNGGLTALMLVEMFRAHAGREPRSISTRMLRPLFCGSRNRIRIVADGGSARVWAENAQGEVAAEAIIA